MCGSTEHPHPAKKGVESVDISEEKLQNMQTNVDKLRKDQEKAAGDAAAARSEYDTRKDTYIASVRKLQERLHRSISSITEQSSVTEMSNALENWKQQTETELEKLTADAKLLVKIREALQNVEKQKKQLQDTYDECTEKEKAAAEKLAGSEAALENVKGSVEFKTEEEARAALLQAEDSKKQAEEVYQKVLAEAKKAANAQKQAETLISRYQQEIPEQKKCVEDRKTSYTEVMEIKQMTESEWKELVETYSVKRQKSFRKRLMHIMRKRLQHRQDEILRRMQLGNQNVQCWKNFRKKKKLQKRNIWRQKRFITNCE